MPSHFHRLLLALALQLAEPLASGASAAEEAVEVLVIGAGVSGLTTAYELLNAGVPGARIAILEQRHQPGGRTINIDVPGYEGKKVEAGGTWIGGTQDRVASLSRELGLTPEGNDFFHTYYDIDKTTLWGKEIYTDDDGAKCTPIQDAWPTANKKACTQTGTGLDLPTGKELLLLRELRTMAKLVSMDDPWNSKLAHLDNTTVLKWMQEHGYGDQTDVTFVNGLVGIPLNANISQISMLFYLFYENSCPSLDDSGFTGGAQDWRFTAGSQELSLRLAANVTARGVRILYNTSVESVVNTIKSVVITSSPTDGGGASTVWTAKQAVVAMGTGDAGRLEYKGITDQRQALMDGWIEDAGGGLKFFLIYETAFWRRPFYNGSAAIPAIGVGLNANKGTGEIYFDYSDQSGVPGVLAGFASGGGQGTVSPSGDGGINVTPAQREAYLAKQICKLSNLALIPGSCDHVGYTEQRWNLTEPVGGTSNIVQYMAPGTLTSLGPSWRKAIGRLHWAGSDTAVRWMGYIDGAVESGQRVAREVAAAL